jgi:hypothetical protein
LKSRIIAAGLLVLAVQIYAQTIDQGTDPVDPIVKTVRALTQGAVPQIPATAPAAAEAPCPKTKGKVGCDSYYPDPAKTPGHPDPKITQANIQDTVCKDHYTTTVRSVNEDEKKAEFTTYDIKPTDSPFGYEIDHFISLELGGTNDPDNLWPQPYCQPGTGGKTCIGAREKDVVETSLSHRVCAGKITLLQAQEIIKTDWYKEYLSLKGE